MSSMDVARGDSASDPLLAEAHGASTLPISPNSGLSFRGTDGDEWGRIAEEMRAGKHSGRIAVWRDGHALEWLDVEKNIVGSAQQAKRAGAQAVGAGKVGASVGKPPGAINSRTITAVVAGACLVGLAAWAMSAWGNPAKEALLLIGSTSWRCCTPKNQLVSPRSACASADLPRCIYRHSFPYSAASEL